MKIGNVALPAKGSIGSKDSIKASHKDASPSVAGEIAGGTRLAAKDRAIISGPGRERHRELRRLTEKLSSHEAGKSTEELGELSERLERGDFDGDQAIHEAAKRFLSD